MKALTIGTCACAWMLAACTTTGIPGPSAGSQTFHSAFIHRIAESLPAELSILEIRDSVLAAEEWRSAVPMHQHRLKVDQLLKGLPEQEHADTLESLDQNDYAAHLLASLKVDFPQLFPIRSFSFERVVQQPEESWTMSITAADHSKEDSRVVVSYRLGCIHQVVFIGVEEWRRDPVRGWVLHRVLRSDSSHAP